MIDLNYVRTSTGFTYIGPVAPIDAEEGDTWLDTSQGYIPRVYNGHSFDNLGESIASSGYMVAGNNTVSNLNTFEKLRFGLETTSTLSSTLNDSYKSAAGFYSYSTGYICGGVKTGPTTLDTIERLTFTSEVTSTMSTTLDHSNGRYSHSACESLLNGYIFGGIDSTLAVLDSIEKFNFSSETSTGLATTVVLSSAKHSSGSSSSVNNGYCVAGEDDLSSKTQTVDKLEFSSDSISNLSITYNEVAKDLMTFKSRGNGYFVGGEGDNTQTEIQTCNKINFSTDSMSLLSSNLEFGRYQGVGMSSFATGFLGGGYGDITGGYTDSIEAMDFSDEAFYSLSETLESYKLKAAGLSYSG